MNFYRMYCLFCHKRLSTYKTISPNWIFQMVMLNFCNTFGSLVSRSLSPTVQICVLLPKLEVNNENFFNLCIANNTSILNLFMYFYEQYNFQLNDKFYFFFVSLRVNWGVTYPLPPSFDIIHGHPLAPVVPKTSIHRHTIYNIS